MEAAGRSFIHILQPCGVTDPSDSSTGRLIKEDRYISDSCESAPFVFNGSLMLMECIRPPTGGERRDYFIEITEVKTGRQISRFAYGYGLASLVVEDGQVWVFASRWEDGTWNDVTLFRSTDLSTWSSRKVLEQGRGEHIFNTSVCKDADRYVMAYETDDPRYVPFTVKFARSNDLVNWDKIPGALFGPDRYAACPCLRYSDGWYYMLYLEHLSPRWWFETYMVRSKDLRTWFPSPRNPILSPGKGEGINTSDPDLVEFEGKVYLYYCIGDQRTYGRLKRAVFHGTLEEFFQWCYQE